MSEREYRHIIRVAGTDIDGQQNLLQGLTRIRGVGLRLSKTDYSQVESGSHFSTRLSNGFRGSQD